MAFNKKQQAWSHTKAGQKILGAKKGLPQLPDSTLIPGAVSPEPPFVLPTHISRVTTR